MTSDEFSVKYDGKHYDLNKFLKNHPGGVNYVQNYKDKDVTKRMEETQHSKSALYLLREYQKDGRDDSNKDEDEDLEKLVDWNRPMLSQVTQLGSMYKVWVTAPVDRQLRLFENPVLEFLTITPWFVVPLIWIPIITYFIFYGVKKYIDITKETSPTLPVLLSMIFGIILWTFIEYSLHRWIFHLEPSGSSKALIYVHFAIHGLHHKVPFDSRRLVFPPLPAAALAYIAYIIFTLTMPESITILVLAGGLLGYVAYDMIHFYLHYGAPDEGSYLYNMKRYHNQHHFAHHNQGFGISSLYWDKVFGTSISLRRLGMGIKW